MAITRLTIALREQIKDAMLWHAFEKKYEKQVQAECDFAEVIYKHIYKDTLETMLKLPDDFFAKRSEIFVEISGKREYINWARGSNFNYNSWIKSKKKRPWKPVANKHTSYIAAEVFDANHKFAIQHAKLKEAVAFLYEEIKTATANIEAILSNCNSIEKLITIWPECEKIASKFKKEKQVIATANLPTPQMDNLNILLHLPPA